MKKEVKYRINENGSYNIKETKTQTPEDGFVPDHTMRPLEQHNRGKYHYGHRTTVSYTTNDPKVTRPFVYGICGLFFAIGLVLCFCGSWFLGLFFIAIISISFFKAKKDIDNVADDLKNKYPDLDVTIDSPEELKDVASGIGQQMKEGFQEAAKQTYTKDAYNNIVRVGLPFYIIVCLIALFIVGYFIHVILALFLLILFIVIGVLFFGLLKIICRH